MDPDQEVKGDHSRILTELEHMGRMTFRVVGLQAFLQIGLRFGEFPEVEIGDPDRQISLQQQVIVVDLDRNGQKLLGQFQRQCEMGTDNVVCDKLIQGDGQLRRIPDQSAKP